MVNFSKNLRRPSLSVVSRSVPRSRLGSPAGPTALRPDHARTVAVLAVAAIRTPETMGEIYGHYDVLRCFIHLVRKENAAGFKQ